MWIFIFVSDFFPALFMRRLTMTSLPRYQTPGPLEGPGPLFYNAPGQWLAESGTLCPWSPNPRHSLDFVYNIGCDCRWSRRRPGAPFVREWLIPSGIIRRALEVMGTESTSITPSLTHCTLQPNKLLLQLEMQCIPWSQEPAAIQLTSIFLTERGNNQLICISPWFLLFRGCLWMGLLPPRVIP